MDSTNKDLFDVSGINMCLSSLGMDTIQSHHDIPSKLQDITMYHINWINERTALEERCSKLQSDTNNYLNMVDRVQGELEASRREVTAVSEKERQLRVKNKHLASRLKSEEEEVKKLTLMMEHKQDHFNHEIRKKERETLQLKERLSKKIMEKKTEKGTNQVLNTVPRRVGGCRAQWGTDPKEELYKQIVEEQEEKNKELILENDHLRHCLAGQESELINVLNEGDANQSFLEDKDLDPKIQSLVNMPYMVVQDTFKSSIDEKIELIKEKHRRLANNKDLKMEVEKLRKTVEEQQLAITEQLVIIEDCTCQKERHNYSDIHDAELESRFQMIMVEKEEIEKERENLRKEKDELTILEAKIKDDHKKFREERTQLFESNLLATPNITSIKRENKIRNDSPLSVTEHVKPNLQEGHLYFSPAPTENAYVATTEEFNRELSRLDLSNLHGKILNDNTTTPLRVKTDNVRDSTKDNITDKEMFLIKQQLINQYMNTPV